MTVTRDVKDIIIVRADRDYAFRKALFVEFHVPESVLDDCGAAQKQAETMKEMARVTKMLGLQ